VVGDLQRDRAACLPGEVDPDLPLDETLGALAATFTYPFRYGYSAVGRVLRPAGPLREGQRVFAFHPTRTGS
jgi:hypothetical protein